MLKLIVRRIVEVAQPDRILLFGSAARGPRAFAHCFLAAERLLSRTSRTSIRAPHRVVIGGDYRRLRGMFLFNAMFE